VTRGGRGGIRFDFTGGGVEVTVPEPGWYPPAVSAAIATSPDGQWIAVRQGEALRLYSTAGAEAGAATLATADADIAIVGPPTSVIVVERRDDATSVAGLSVPGLGETVRVTVDGAHELAATTGPRLALIARGNRSLAILRASGRAFMSQGCDPGGPVELVAGLDRNQLLVVLAKRLEIWDAVSCRPQFRPSFALPPAPRVLGACAGHAWSYAIGGTELVLYRLSDGRPFAHRLGAKILAVASHPATAYVVAITEAGPMRIQGFAHTIERFTCAPAEAFGLAGAMGSAVGSSGVPASELRLVGAGADGAPWIAPLLDPGAARGELGAEDTPTTTAVNEKIRAARERAVEPAADAGARGTSPPPSWREPLATFAEQLATKDAAKAEIPPLPLDTTLAQLCHRAQLATPARRALTALYGAYLAGEPGIAIARLARLVGGDDGWREALGTGELGDRLLVTTRAGRVSIVDAIARVLDGAAPSSVAIVGTGAGALVAGAHVVDPGPLGEPIAALTGALGRFALVGGSLASGVLEAYAHGLTAVAIVGPGTRLFAVRVPRGGGLLVVAPPEHLPPAMAMWPTLDPRR
jgi:hypothetical protein